MKKKILAAIIFFIAINCYSQTFNLFHIKDGINNAREYMASIGYTEVIDDTDIIITYQYYTNNDYKLYNIPVDAVFLYEYQNELRSVAYVLYLPGATDSDYKACLFDLCIDNGMDIKVVENRIVEQEYTLKSYTATNTKERYDIDILFNSRTGMYVMVQVYQNK